MVLRELFDSMHTSTLAFLTTTTVGTKLRKMRKKRLLTKPQWKSLFPTTTTCGKSTDFDIALLFKLLREFCVLTPPSKGWDELPDDKDLTLPADLARIKYYRNEVYAHVNDNMDLDDTEFQDLWKRIKDALLRIVKHYNPSDVSVWEEAIEKLLRDPLSEEIEEYEEELEEWYLQDQDVKKMLSNGMKEIRKEFRSLKHQVRHYPGKNKTS